MKELKKEKSSIFSNMFTNVKLFKAVDVSDWTIPHVFYLKDLNAKQLQLIALLEIEIFDEGEILFIRLNNKDHKVVIRTLAEQGKILVDYRKKLELIPLWIRKIFKAN